MVLCHRERRHAENPPFNARKALFRVALRNGVFTHGAVQSIADSVPHGPPHERSPVGQREHVGVFPYVVPLHPSEGKQMENKKDTLRFLVCFVEFTICSHASLRFHHSLPPWLPSHV